MVDLISYKNVNVNKLVKDVNTTEPLLTQLKKITPENIYEPYTYGILQSIIIEAIYTKTYFQKLIYVSLYGEEPYKKFAGNIVDFIMHHINNTPKNVNNFDRFVHRELVYSLQFHPAVIFL